jgi:hypothetical protein
MFSEPNHIHGIMILSNVGAQFIAPFRKTTTKNQGVMNHAPTVRYWGTRQASKKMPHVVKLHVRFI